MDGSPGKQGATPGETKQDDDASDAAHVCQQTPVRRLVVGVLFLDPGQLDHNHDEDQQAQSKDQEEVGHHTHIEGGIITYPTATRTQRKTQMLRLFLMAKIYQRKKSAMF